MGKSNYRFSTLLTASLVVGFIGFGLGFNFPALQSELSRRFAGGEGQTLPDDLDLTGVEAIYDQLRQNFDGQLEAEELIDGAKSGLVRAAGDPFTEYMDAEAARAFNESLEGTFSGIGAQIAIKNNRLVIMAPLPQTPAERAGLKPGDHIAAVNGQDTSLMTLEEAVAKIRGPEASEVTLIIVRGTEPPKEVKIIRASIDVPSVRSEIKEGGVGYIELNRFGSDTSADFEKAVSSLKAQGINKIVLDLRNNPGGLLQAAIDVSDELLSSGTIVEVRRGSTVTDVERARNGGLFSEGKLVVLINEGSASASEIVAGALQDNGRATIVGKQSFGKGSVQEVSELRDGSLLKVTTSHWYTPKGRSISAEGIKPDIGVELSEDDFNNSRDPQLQKALELVRG